ncbi:MAG: amino acid decarboxylase, partial [Deltaproteobacteria bacterium]|nr:amino acid decarboxylase [Deltaproteobacteria bacterium]
MESREFTVHTEEEAYNLSASVRLIGADVLVAIWGGERPHIG